MKYKEYKKLDLTELSKVVQSFWEENKIFKKSIENREGADEFVFYEGPPSANGMPGIHHVLGRTIKDIFCRYKSLKGFKVERKGGWDTHGLPVELQVEKRLNITKDDIGKKISIEDYNKACREDVMKFKKAWDDITTRIGFWLDLENPYITYDNNYIESVWHLLKQLHEKNLLYKGYSIQPFSPAAGTNLSSHELGQPGCYRLVKDISVTAQFKVKQQENTYLLAWTTTPWTLPSNSALAVGKKIDYFKVKTLNRYTGEEINVILAKDTLYQYFDKEFENSSFENFKTGQINLPFILSDRLKGTDLEGLEYEQLLAYVDPGKNAFKVYAADFVNTDEGTGIVHIAPTFGADDYKLSQQHNIPALLVADVNKAGKFTPLVDKQGKFVEEVIDFAGRYVKDFGNDTDYKDVNLDIVVKLKKENKAFKVEKLEHNYPHCWRTDKPVLYYPMESWFIKTTVMRDRLIELNNTINWKPGYTGTGRFGNWLENLVDWNLSRTRYWATPLPVWLTDDESELKCIGSYEELKKEVALSVEKGFMKSLLNENFDPHRPFIDKIILVSSKGKPMKRVEDVIDVWFESGAMPYAQWHYPFENKEKFKRSFPADFIAEGVDQTRGWFFTLHAIAGLLFDSVAFKNVVSNGLVLDKEGNKMSKRLGNVVDPFQTVEKYGADPTRWYMVHNAQPWDNLKFDLNGVDEIRKKFFGTLYNTYTFFALYANIDGFAYKEEPVPIDQRPEIDRWVISLLNSLILEVNDNMENYEPTKAVRQIQDFVTEHLSNWYVRLSRRRFWKGDYSNDKISAYQTLYDCLESVSLLMAPFAPFYSEVLFRDLNAVSKRKKQISIHLCDFPVPDTQLIDKSLEERMELAQKITSTVLALRKKSKIRVRQPLNKIMIPALNKKMTEQLDQIKDLVLSEVNVKNIEFIPDTSDLLVKQLKPDFKKLGPKYGAEMKFIQQAISKLDQKEIQNFEQNGKFDLNINGTNITISTDEVEIRSEDIPGWLVENSGNITIALDISITDELKKEGIARELINKIQNLRKDKGFEVTDHINVEFEEHIELNHTIIKYKQYICTEILADNLSVVSTINKNSDSLELFDNLIAKIKINKVNNGGSK